MTRAERLQNILNEIRQDYYDLLKKLLVEFPEDPTYKTLLDKLINCKYPAYDL